MQTKLIKQYHSIAHLLKSPSFKYKRNIQHSDLLGDIYPFGQDHFHEMNPILSSNITSLDALRNIHAITLRDGAYVLADFILKYISSLINFPTHFFVEHKLAKIIPSNLKKNFGVWKIVQHEDHSSIKKYNTLLIQGIASDFSLSLNMLERELEKIKDFEFDNIKIYLPIRKNPFDLPWTESTIAAEAIEMIKSYYPQKKFNYLKTKDLLEASQWTGTYSIDLLGPSGIVSDQYINFELLSRGGVLNNIDHYELENSLFEVELSFYHKIQFASIPEVDSIFSDLLFHKKSSKSKHLTHDEDIKRLISEKVL